MARPASSPLGRAKSESNDPVVQAISAIEKRLPPEPEARGVLLAPQRGPAGVAIVLERVRDILLAKAVAAEIGGCPDGQLVQREAQRLVEKLTLLAWSGWRGLDGDMRGAFEQSLELADPSAARALVDRLDASLRNLEPARREATIAHRGSARSGLRKRYGAEPAKEGGAPGASPKTPPLKELALRIARPARDVIDRAAEGAGVSRTAWLVDHCLQHLAQGTDPAQIEIAGPASATIKTKFDVDIVEQIDRAAKQAGRTRTDWILSAALEAAER